MVLWYGNNSSLGNPQDIQPLGMVMFQSYGIHGPVLGPVTGLVIDIILLALAFWMLASPDMKKVSNILTFVTLVASISLLRVVMTPLPNIQPVTVAALIIGAQLGARRGVAFAVLVTMISNFIIGDGIWTLYQARLVGSCDYWSILKNNHRRPIEIEQDLRLCSNLCIFIRFYRFIKRFRYSKR